MSQDLRDAQEGPFEDWWTREGQYLRAGGDSYAKTFAWHAWCEATGRAQAPAAEPQWLCPKCGVDRFKSACPKGHSAALTGDCPMVGTAAAKEQQP